jgi:surface protein
MFSNAIIFNQNIGNWNVSKVTSFQSMFIAATEFNNGGSNTIQNWSAPLCTTFASMFQSATNFNQPLTNLVNTSGVSNCLMNNMFRGASSFNQNIGNWNTSNVTTMAGMFSQASLFNQNIGNWNTSNVTNMSDMFAGANSLVNTNIFNNGETGLQVIPNINPSNASYTNSIRTLTCLGATFLTTLSIGDVLIIQTSTIFYSSSIESITNDTTLILTDAYGTNIPIGIISIQKQIPGSSPLNWNTSKVTNMSNMFIYCVFFNQNLTTWNTNLVTNLSQIFRGNPTSLITLFNNGQIITGTTAPMGWTFTAVPNSTNYRTNCRLTSANKPASLS